MTSSRQISAILLGTLCMISATLAIDVPLTYEINTGSEDNDEPPNIQNIKINFTKNFEEDDSEEPPIITDLNIPKIVYHPEHEVQVSNETKGELYPKVVYHPEHEVQKTNSTKKINNQTVQVSSPKGAAPKGAIPTQSGPSAFTTRPANQSGTNPSTTPRPQPVYTEPVGDVNGMGRWYYIDDEEKCLSKKNREDIKVVSCQAALAMFNEKMIADINSRLEQLAEAIYANNQTIVKQQAVQGVAF